MRICDNGVYRDMTDDEIAELFNDIPDITEYSDPIANEYSESTMYKAGELVQYNGEMYRFKLNRAKGILPTNKTYWEKVNMTTIINELKEEK